MSEETREILQCKAHNRPTGMQCKREATQDGLCWQHHLWQGYKAKKYVPKIKKVPT